MMVSRSVGWLVMDGSAGVGWLVVDGSAGVVSLRVSNRHETLEGMEVNLSSVDSVKGHLVLDLSVVHVVTGLGVELRKLSYVKVSVSVLVESLEDSPEVVIGVSESSVGGDVHVLLELVKGDGSAVVSVVHSELGVEFSSGEMDTDLGVKSGELSLVNGAGSVSVHVREHLVNLAVWVVVVTHLFYKS